MSRVRIKICGITTAEDARLAADAGADAVGINFYPRSPRFVDPRLAPAVVQALPPMIDTVGVFVDTPMRQICAIAFQLGLGSVQSFASVGSWDDAKPFRHIAAFRVKSAEDVRAIHEYVRIGTEANRRPAAVLVDSHVEGQFGGTGKTAPWDLLVDFHPSVPWILAGGLTPDNVAEAIQRLRPYAVDVASGVESSPGRKDPEKLRRFIENVRAAC